jgi:competence protein ComEC
MATRDAGAPSIADAPRPRARLPRFSAASGALERLAEAERDQLPLWLPVGLILGISAWFWLPDESGWAAFLLAALALSVGLLALAAGARWGRGLAVFSLAAAIGCGLIWWKAERVAAPRLERARMVEVTARVESVQSLAAERTIRLVVAPEQTGMPARLRVNVDEGDAAEELDPGATVRIRAWLMPPAPMAAPGAYDFARTAWFQRIGGSGRALDIAIVAPAGEQGWRARIADWRQRLAAHVRERLDGAEGGIAAALATGDQYGIPEEDAEAMRRSGLAHLLSVSGLHLTAVVGAVMLLTLKLLALSPVLALRLRLVLIAAGAGALAGIAYTLLTGAEVPTVRACIAALLVLAGIALGREAITLRLVAVGALAVLVLWPESLPGPSFQMSFAAITAIVALHENPRIQALFSRRDEGWPSRWGRALFALILTGLAVELALTPIALFHFHKAGLYGALANVVAIPLTTFVIMPLEALALLLDLIGLGAPFWWLAAQALSFLLWLAHATAAAPGAVALLPAIPRGAYALMVAGGLWICLWRTRLRRLGLIPVAAGAIWALVIPAPDLIVTGDGRHLVLRSPSGELALLRPRAGDYVRDTLAELSAAEPNFLDLDRLPVAACSPDLCAANLTKGGRTWRILATRTPHFVRWDRMVQACADADIIVSDRLLPRGCNPRWLKIDRAFLRRTGGLAITLGSQPEVATVAGQTGRHPWAQTTSLQTPEPSRMPVAAASSP